MYISVRPDVGNKISDWVNICLYQVVQGRVALLAIL